MADDEDTEPWAPPRRAWRGIYATPCIGPPAPEVDPVDVPRYPKRHPVPPREVVLEAIAEADRRFALYVADPPLPPARNMRVRVPVDVSPPTKIVTGRCHDCSKAIPDGRLFCGRCLVKHGHSVPAP